MKKAILNLMGEYQQKSMGHLGVMSYQYSNLCVKADGSSLLGIEIDDDDSICHIEDLAYVKLHDEEGDDDKMDIIPKNGDDDLQSLSQGVMSVHPEFIQSMEEMENGMHMLRLTMPPVNKDRKDVLDKAIQACYDECKAKLDVLNTYYTAAVEAQLIGESPDVVVSVTENMKTVREKFAEVRDQFKTDKLKEVDDAYQRYLAGTQEMPQDGVLDEYSQNIKIN